MKKIIYIIFFLMTFSMYSQQNWLQTAKDDLNPLSKAFNSKKEQYEVEKQKLIEISKSLSEDPKEQYDLTLKLKKELDSIYKTRITFIDFYLSKKVENDSLMVYFPEEENYTFQDEPVKEEVTEMDNTLSTKTTYYLFGDKDLIKEEDLINNKEVNQIFSKVINEKSQSNLGKFEIPAVGQLIPVYRQVMKDTVFKKGTKIIDYKNSKYVRAIIYVSFEEVNLTIKEGAFEDIRVTLIDKKSNKKYYFENRLSASLLRNTRNGKNFNLFCSFVSSIDNVKPYIHDKNEENCYIFLKDVLQYEPNSGNNYVPDDQNLVFPLHEDTIQKKENRGIYNLVQNTSLQNTVELRTYTDFLGLFNDSPNGIVQVEGRAEFFMVPFRVSNKNSIYFFKKITPYINYSKIDETSRGLDLVEQTTTPESTFTIKTPLQIFEKSYLELGVNFNIVSFKFTKEMPFKVNINFPLRYNATSVYQDNTDNTNFKMVSYGGGLNFEFKKFSNFGFNYSVEFTNSRSINKSEVIINPSSFWVFRNEAELFYYPGESKNQSIFTRFRTFYNSKDNRDSFFQLQFGYRFSIGAGKVKS